MDERDWLSIVCPNPDRPAFHRSTTDAVVVLSGSRHGMEWYLTHCWHCEEAEVPPDDDLGLCVSCRADLAETRVAV